MTTYRVPDDAGIDDVSPNPHLERDPEKVRRFLLEVLTETLVELEDDRGWPTSVIENPDGSLRIVANGHHFTLEVTGHMVRVLTLAEIEEAMAILNRARQGVPSEREVARLVLIAEKMQCSASRIPVGGRLP